MCVERSVHRADAGRKSQPNDQPRVRSHESITPAGSVQSPRSEGDDTDAQASVHEGLVQVFTLIHRHSTIFTRLSVEDQVCGNDGSTNQSTAIEKSLRQVSTGSRVGGLVRGRLIAALEAIAKSCRFQEGLCPRCRRPRVEEDVRGFGTRRVEGSDEI